MSALSRWCTIVVCWLLATFVAPSAWAMGLESFGPADEHISRSSDWPQGVEDVLRHKSRVYWNWVNGNEHAYYIGDLETINELLALFAKIDQLVREVIVRPGSPSVRSFDGKLTPYNVEFEIPSGIYLHHIQELATTGLYSVVPRLIVYIDDGFAERLDELKFPANVMLRAWPHRVEDALRQIRAKDRSLRGRAIWALGEAGEASPAVVEALKNASEDEVDYVRNAAASALERIEEANQPEQQALREQVAKYLSKHPKAWKMPTPDELLEALQKVDAEYAKGFTATGTLMRPAASAEGLLVAWTLTMGKDCLVMEERAIESKDRKAVAGPSEYTIYSGPDFMATIQRQKLWVDGELTESARFARFEPVGSSFDLLIGRTLWPLGRGFSRRIGRITRVEAAADGILIVAAEGGNAGLNSRWELQIDPRANYLVRSAKAFRRDEPDPSYQIDNAGVMAAADRSVAHTARWIEGASARPVSIAVTSISADTDLELTIRVEEWLDEQSRDLPTGVRQGRRSR